MRKLSGSFWEIRDTNMWPMDTVAHVLKILVNMDVFKTRPELEEEVRKWCVQVLY